MLHIGMLQAFSPTVIRKYSPENEKELDCGSDMSAKEEEDQEIENEKVRL